MSWWRRIANGLRGERVSQEIQEELDAHLAEAAHQGRGAEEARHALGPTLHFAEQSREIRVLPWLDSLRADTVFAWRQLKKRKLTSAAAILSLALAIGSCTAAFRLIDALLLRPLPVAHPERLYLIGIKGIDPGGNFRVSEACEYPAFLQMRAAVKDQAELIASSYSRPADLTFSSDEAMEKVNWQYVSGWMFDTFGVPPAAGRLLAERDDVTFGAHPYAVLSYDYWSRRFARDPNVIGRTFRTGATLYTVVGVAAEGFTGTETGVMIDVFAPSTMYPYARSKDSSWLRALVQLKAGVNPQGVLERLRPVYHASLLERVKDLIGRPRSAIDNFLADTLVLEPAGSGRSDLQRTYRPALISLGVLVGLVLLIACANVANLLTAQAASRARELALRVSIGAGRGRLVQLVLVESACLALAAAAAGGLLAWWAAPFIVSRINPADNPARLALPADWRVLGFGIATALAVTLLFGLAPALRASAIKPALTVKGGEDPHARRRLMHALIAAQVAFCFVVQFTGGLFVSTFEKLSTQSTGFAPERLLVLDTVTVAPQPNDYWLQVAARLRTAPGVESVALAGWPLLDNNASNGFISINGVSAGDTLARFLGISPGWLSTMKIPLISGRDLRPEDTFPGAVIVNQAFVKRFFPNEDPIGRQFVRSAALLPAQIVGIAADARYRDMRETIQPTVYTSFRTLGRDGTPDLRGTGTFLVRTATANPLALAAALTREVAMARPGFRVSRARSQAAMVEAQTRRERLLAVLAGFFGIVALLLSAVGLYGVLDYSVLERRREIGIRMALGARAGEVARRVASRAFAMVALGAAVGLALGMLSVNYIRTLLYGVEATGIEMMATPAIVIITAAAAAAAPAILRAVRIDPARMLRAE